MNPIPRLHATAGSTLFIRFFDRLRRFSESRQLRQMLALRSDRLLADIGLNREQLATEIEATVDALQQRREIERQVRSELESHSDRELQDIGIRRDDIRGIAREHAQQAIAVNRFGSLAATRTLQTNDNAGRWPRRDLSEKAA
jgi:uncharacterized protein YjiS (DUF1127 family)